MLRYLLKGWFGDGEPFYPRPEPYDGLDFFWVVRGRWDNEKPGEEIWWNAVSSDYIFSAADGAFAAI